jgi:hypothetical protein
MTVAACGSHGESPARSDAWPTRTELGWLREFASWSTKLETAELHFQTSRRKVYAAFGQRSMPLLRRDASGIGGTCASLASAVPAPPTPRLDEALASAHSACRAYARLAHAVADGRTAVAYGVLAVPWVKVLRTAERRFQHARDLALLGLRRPLPPSADPRISSHSDPVLGHLARTLASKNVVVHCWSPSDWRRVAGEYAIVSRHSEPRTPWRAEGWTPVGGSRIDVDASVCREAERFAHASRSIRSATPAAADAVRVIAHEAIHTAGEADEATTECTALQSVANAARGLGATPAVARALARLAWIQYGSEPPPYRTAECRNGGRLDLRPGESVCRSRAGLVQPARGRERAVRTQLNCGSTGA